VTDQTIAPAQQDYPAPAYGWYVVSILTLAYMVSFLDRQILNLLVEPIKADIGVTDFQMSLLMGLAFAMFYTVLGIPIGRLADRRSRRGIIAAGITLWCLMTAAFGLARNYFWMFLARVGVGVGEATLSPSALSLISDYFPREKRGLPLSIYNMGVSLGAGVAFLFGGFIIQYAFAQPPVNAPIVGELKAWQTVFIVVGLPGLLIAALMITVKEPTRKDTLKTADGSAAVIPIRDVAKFLAERWRTYGSHFLGMSVVTILGYVYFSWIPTCFIRTWGWEISQISYAYGIIMLIFGPLGVTLGGLLTDRLYNKGYKDAHMRVVLFLGAGLMVPFGVLVPLMPTPEWAVALLIPFSIGGAAATAAGGAALMMITPNQMRGQASALYYFVINLFGLTIGPSAVAAITDFVYGDDAALRYSIAWVCGVAGVIAVGFLVYNLKQFAQSLEEAEAIAAASN